MTIRIFTVIAALVAMTTVRPAAQSTTVRADLLADWSEMKDRMLKIADAMPEDRLSYKPTPAQRTYGEQIVHVAADNVALMKLLGGTPPAPALGTSVASKADVLQALAASYEYPIHAASCDTSPRSAPGRAWRRNWSIADY